jgi:hypothetical protein
MKTDFYTKTILTVIAVCLIAIIVQQGDIMPKAYAGTPSASFNPNVNYGLVPLNADGTIDVNIKSSSTMDVNIESCSSYAFQYAGPMEVKVK